MVLNIYARKRVLSLYFQGHTVSSIVDHLCLEDGIVVSKQGLRKFLKHYTEQGTIERKQGSGCPSKIMPGIQQIIENAMRRDDETTATQIQAILASYGVYVSLTTIIRKRHQMGWIYQGSAGEFNGIWSLCKGTISKSSQTIRTKAKRKLISM